MRFLVDMPLSPELGAGSSKKATKPFTPRNWD